MKFCAECGTRITVAAGTERPAPKTLSDEEQIVILDREIARLSKQGWEIEGRPTPYEVCLRRKSGLTARQFLPLWVEDDGSVWTNAGGVMEGGRLRDFPSLFRTQPTALQPTLWRAAPGSKAETPGLGSRQLPRTIPASRKQIVQEAELGRLREPR
jgi:hypothetical protein